MAVRNRTMDKNEPVPVNIRLRKQTRTLDVEFSSGETYSLSAEYLRTHSPSAEVQGHSPDTATLVTGKASVAIVGLEPVGNYAIRVIFDDGHDTGLFTWKYLYTLGRDRARNWQAYEAKVAEQRSPGVWNG